jgi:hypothetical protein
MGAAVLVMNLEHVLVGAPRLLNLAIVLFVLVAFPLAWLIHRRHCKRLPIKKRFQWAGRVEACNRVAIGGWVAAMGWIALGHSGILPVPTVESMLPWTIVTVPLIAWLLGVVAKLIAKRFDPDWWE